VSKHPEARPQVRVLRDGAVIYTSKLNSLKHSRMMPAKSHWFECGAGVANFND